MRLIITALLFGISLQLSAQCAHDPVVIGDGIYCPEVETAIISSSVTDGDSYQWYRRFFSGGTEEVVAGATEFELEIVLFDDALYYFYVDVTKDGCTARSDELLIDQWVFALPTVISTGDYTSGGDGSFLICEGDTMTFTLNPPYVTTITWYESGVPIPGETSTSLEVSEPGVYTVSGAPGECPDFVLFLGVDLVVNYNTDTTFCGLSTEEFNADSITLYPNPARDRINIEGITETLTGISVYNILGQEFNEIKKSENQSFIDVSELTSGIYFIQLQTDYGIVVKRFVKQ